MKQYYIYILTNARKTVFYIGVTNNLERRIYEHKNNLVEGFTKKYNVENLIYFEVSPDVNAAIVREKQLKKWSRIKKLNLVKTINPELFEITSGSLDKLEMTEEQDYSSVRSTRQSSRPKHSPYSSSRPQHSPYSSSRPQRSLVERSQ